MKQLGSILVTLAMSALATGATSVLGASPARGHCTISSTRLGYASAAELFDARAGSASP